jgi:hypothetical protein
VIFEVEFTGRRRVEPAQYVEERRFAAAGGSEQYDQFARTQFEICAAQSVDINVARVIDLGQTLPDEAARVLTFRCSATVLHIESVTLMSKTGLCSMGAAEKTRLVQIEIVRQVHLLDVDRLRAHVERIGSI